MRLIKHIYNLLWVKLWAVLAVHGIGDPLNQLVYVAPYRLIPRKPLYKSRRLPYRRHTVTEAKIAKDIDAIDNIAKEIRGEGHE